MPCKDTTSEINIVLDKKDHLLNFDYSKKTCNKEVGGGTGFREFCIGKSVDVLVKLELHPSLPPSIHTCIHTYIHT